MPRKPQIAPEELTAKILSFSQAYYVSQRAGENARLDDEAQIEILGTITDISKRHRRFLGDSIEVSLLRARSFRRHEDNPATERPFLLNMDLRKGRCTCAGYIPADVFWALPEMLRMNAVTHVQVTFEPTTRGDGELLSIYIAPETKLEPIR
jgi:hypothetical protein